MKVAVTGAHGMQGSETNTINLDFDSDPIFVYDILDLLFFDNLFKLLINRFSRRFIRSSVVP